MGKKVVVELSTGCAESSIYVYYNSADMMLSHVNHHQKTKILSGPDQNGRYYAQKMSHENLFRTNLAEIHKASEDETDLYLYSKDGVWKKHFSYLH